MTEIECVLDAKAQLGEGAVWDPAQRVLWWVDIVGNCIHRFNPVTRGNHTYAAPEAVGCVSPRSLGGLVVGLASGFHFFDPLTRRYSAIIDPEADLPQTRLNDGRTDRQGRFWAGSMMQETKEEPSKTAALYRLDTDLTCHRIVGDVGCSNGLAWSVDGRTMYHADSHTPYVNAWDFDPTTGQVARCRRFADLTDVCGVADGATVDADDCYWVTVPFQAKILRYDPDGRLMQTVHLPTALPTCCEFGGSDLDVLYVTTARLGYSPEQLARDPHAGGLFALNAGVRGVPSRPFDC
jgi:sugar lactone lactonase YvrE